MPSPKRLAAVCSATALAVSGLLLGSATSATYAASGSPSAPSTTGSTTSKSSTTFEQAQQAAKDEEAHPTHKAAGCATPHKDKHGEPMAVCHAEGRIKKDTGTFVTRADEPVTGSLGPSEIQSAYALAGTSAAGRVVAIVDAGGYANAEADLNVWRAHYGLTACTTANGCFTKLDQRGGTDYPAEDSGWSVETALDLDAVSAACPDCKLVLVEGDDASGLNLSEAVNTAADVPGVVAISNSYGIAGELDADSAAYLEPFYDHPGIAVTASTGDTGHVQNWPATSGDVVAVGGTLLTQDASTSRGWTESAWADGGSGCSTVEPKPAYQDGIETQCGEFKSTADISADADPASGLAVYNTSGQNGWGQWGGTSLASPLVAAMYALAGTPVPGTNPVTYPYYNAGTSTLNDITTGTNWDYCLHGDVTCNAGPGYDGPTGVGTPAGVAALTLGAYGSVSGKVTDQDGKALTGVTVTAKDAAGHSFTATTGDDGVYALSSTVGDVTVTATKFGYDNASDTVEVLQGKTAAADLSITAQETRTVSGVVSDASGQGWPVYARITIGGYPNGAVFTDPATGRYSVDLPVNQTYTFHTTPVALPGYETSTTDVDLTDATADVTHDIGLSVDESTCAANGYAWDNAGTGTSFEGWHGTDAQDGWSIVNNLDPASSSTWSFDDLGNRGNLTGASGTFAIIDSDHDGRGKQQDSSLVSPVTDLSSISDPHIQFSSYVQESFGSASYVDLSIDGGTTWQTVWSKSDNDFAGGPQDIDIPQAGGVAQAQVRFRYTGSYAWYWEVDDVLVGSRTCGPAGDGGFVTGEVTDHNTGAGVPGARVTGDGVETTTTATPEDPAVSDGYFSAYVPTTGDLSLSAARGAYTAGTGTVTVAAKNVVRRDLALTAGHVSLGSTKLDTTLELGRTATKTVTLTNDGTEDTTVRVDEQRAGFTPAAKPAPAAPPVRIAGDGKRTDGPLTSGHKAGTDTTTVPAASGWTSATNLPEGLADEAAATVDGKVYVFGGVTADATGNTSQTSDATVYDPATQQWTAIKPLPAPLEGAAAEVIDGQVYLFGGWDDWDSYYASDRAYRYDPARNTYEALASLPVAVTGAGHAVVDGLIYLVGGCTGDCQPGTTATQVYDPASDSWSIGADYPVSVAWEACGSISDDLYCAGGSDVDNPDPENWNGFDKTYAYDPVTDTWSARARMPYPVMGGFTTVHDSQLQIIAGDSTGGSVVNTAITYDPVSDVWSSMANAPMALYRGASACGLYALGGQSGAWDPRASVYQLSDDGCDSQALDWLSSDTSSVTLAPGESKTVTVSLDSLAAGSPGSYLGKVEIASDTPYAASTVDVDLSVTAPATWGKIAGVVKDGDGQPITGATVQVCGNYTGTGCTDPQWTLHTDVNGHYQLWTDENYGTFLLSASYGTLATKSTTVTISGGATTTADFTLTKAVDKKAALISLTTASAKVKGTTTTTATAVVTASGGATGDVVFTVVGGSKTWTVTGTLASGSVTVTLPDLPKGSYTVQATYLGSDTVQTVTSSKVTVSVGGGKNS